MFATWDFFQNQVLGMQWLHDLLPTLLAASGIDATSRVGSTLHFFLYDTVKILILLSVLIFAISYIQSYFPPERTKRILGKYKGIKANCLSALLGTVTPFCSCSSIPLFIGFTSARLPLGVTFSFLISSPLVDLASFILLMSVFGWEIATIYVVVGLVLAVVGGTLIGKLGMEKYIENSARNALQMAIDIPSMTRKDRIRYSYAQLKYTVKNVFWYIIIGASIGALIHNWVPETWIQGVLGDDSVFSVLIATLVGIPMYADVFGILPIAEALFAKGVGIGTILAFMMSVTALSLPSIIMLRNVVKPPLLIVFVSIITVGIIIIGITFNSIY